MTSETTGKKLKTGYMTTAQFKLKRQAPGFPVRLLTLLALLLFSACDKTEIKPLPSEPPADTKAWLQVTVTGLQLSGQQHYALLTIENKAGKPVVENKKVTLDQIQGVYKTDKVELPKGEYNLAKFIVVNAADTALYAAPRANTPKASAVDKPLAIPLTISETGINLAPTQVLKIEQSDLPSAFGYTADDFGFQSYISLKVKLRIIVGQVAYDSLPGKLKIDAEGNDNNHWIREIDIKKGVTNIQVPDQYSSYLFKVDKWNSAAVRVMSRNELQTNMLITLEASREPKRLVEEKTFIENSAAVVPDSRTEFYYHSSGKLNEIRNYQKTIQRPDLVLTNLYYFQYSNGSLDTISRFNQANQSTGYTAFFYQNGKISSISNQSYDQHTGVAFEYSGTTDHQVVGADYLFHNGNSMYYRFFTRSGNRISDYALSSTSGSESGTYEYDDYINPKHQLGWEDIFMSNYSKNNLVNQQKSYSGGYPTSVPYKYEYVYDNDGYPSEAYISYKGFTSQDHLFRIKKVYTYQ
jgi:hypothetical protein